MRENSAASIALFYIQKWIDNRKEMKDMVLRILTILTLCQASVMTLWHNGGLPWIELQKPDPLARFLSIFITWSLLRVLQGT